MMRAKFNQLIASVIREQANHISCARHIVSCAQEIAMCTMRVRAHARNISQVACQQTD